MKTLIGLLAWLLPLAGFCADINETNIPIATAGGTKTTDYVRVLTNASPNIADAKTRLLSIGDLLSKAGSQVWTNNGALTWTPATNQLDTNYTDHLTPPVVIRNDGSLFLGRHSTSVGDMTANASFIGMNNIVASNDPPKGKLNFGGSGDDNTTEYAYFSSRWDMTTTTNPWSLLTLASGQSFDFESAIYVTADPYVQLAGNRCSIVGYTNSGDAVFDINEHYISGNAFLLTTNQNTTTPTISLGSFQIWVSNGLALWVSYNINNTVVSKQIAP